jgi:hypothetical protein
MGAHSSLNKDEAKSMVKYILSLKKKIKELSFDLMLLYQYQPHVLFLLVKPYKYQT